jgi:hypothetical protein
MLKTFLVLMVVVGSTFPAGASGGRGSGVEVTDPTGVIGSANMALFETLPEPQVISARFLGNVMYVSTMRGLSTYDVSDALKPVLLGRLALPHFENEDVDLGRGILLISNDAAESKGILYVVDIKDPANPTLLSQVDMGGNPVEGGAGHTVSCILSCRFAWVTDGAGIRVIDLRNPATPVTVGSYPTPAGGGLVTHDVQRDGNRLYWVTGFGGTAAYSVPRRTYDGKGLGTLVTSTNDAGKSRYIETLGLDDGSTYNDYIHHNSLRRNDSDVLYVTEEDYTRPGCKGAGSFQRWHVPLDSKGKPTGEPVTPIDKWSTEMDTTTASPSAMCSAHYFDENTGLIAQGWYQQGLRVLDVSGPTIRQVGYWISPDALVWGAYFPPTDSTDQVIYVLDNKRGIDVMRIMRPVRNSDMPTVEAPVMPQWKAASSLKPATNLGYACPLPI